MLNRRSVLIGLSAMPLASRSAAVGQPIATRPYTYPFSAIIPLDSRENGIAYDLYVRTPPDYRKSTARYPLILLTDADYQFLLAGNIVEHLADRMNQAPKAIIAAIAYRGVYPDAHRYRLQRTRDYTPKPFPTGGYGPVYQAHSGGGPRFLRMIEKEALPLIDEAYRTTPGERTIVGHSYGGLFASWVLQERPDLFNRYLIISPSLWYADQMVLKREGHFSATRMPRRTMAYLAVGSWEEQPERGGHMVTELTRFAEQLRARRDPNLIVKHRIFEDETHASIYPAAFSTGIRHLFSTMSG